MAPTMTPGWQLATRALYVVGIFALGWVAADALDWWRRRRGTGKVSAAEPEGRQLPRHVRRQRGREIAARIARAYASQPDRRN